MYCTLKAGLCEYNCACADLLCYIFGRYYPTCVFFGSEKDPSDPESSCALVVLLALRDYACAELLGVGDGLRLSRLARAS